MIEDSLILDFFFLQKRCLLEEEIFSTKKRGITSKNFFLNFNRQSILSFFYLLLFISKILICSLGFLCLFFSLNFGVFSFFLCFFVTLTSFIYENNTIFEIFISLIFFFFLYYIIYFFLIIDIFISLFLLSLLSVAWNSLLCSISSSLY